MLFGACNFVRCIGSNLLHRRYIPKNDNIVFKDAISGVTVLFKSLIPNSCFFFSICPFSHKLTRWFWNAGFGCTRAQGYLWGRQRDLPADAARSESSFESSGWLCYSPFHWALSWRESLIACESHVADTRGSTFLGLATCNHIWCTNYPVWRRLPTPQVGLASKSCPSHCDAQGHCSESLLLQLPGSRS